MSGIFTIAVHALVYLNRHEEIISSEELAKNICTNPARIRKVMAMLHRANLVKTQAGARGGYSFCGDPESITLQAVCRAVEDSPVPAGWKSGEIDTPCMIASGMSGVLEEVRAELNEACFERLAAITIADINRKIFFDDTMKGGCR